MTALARWFLTELSFSRNSSDHEGVDCSLIRRLTRALTEMLDWLNSPE